MSNHRSQENIQISGEKARALYQTERQKELDQKPVNKQRKRNTQSVAILCEECKTINVKFIETEKTRIADLYFKIQPDPLSVREAR